MKKIRVLEVWDFPQLKYGSVDDITCSYFIMVRNQIAGEFQVLHCKQKLT